MIEQHFLRHLKKKIYHFKAHDDIFRLISVSIVKGYKVVKF